MSGCRPRVSIGMPVYNGERFLREAIDSMLAQILQDFELIISDNASTDGTRDICLDYVRQDPRVRYYRNERNLGAARNFNRLFELSSGEYFKWATADDLAAPHLLEKCILVLDAHPEVVLCYPKTTIIDQNGDVIAQYHDGLDLRSPSVIARFRTAIDQIRLVNVLQGLIRSNVLRNTSLIGPYLGADQVLVAELTLYGKFYEIPEFLFFRRMHPQALSSITSLEGQQEFMDPQTKGKPPLRSWKHQFGHLAAIARAPLTPGERARLAGMIVRSGIADRDTLTNELSFALRHVIRRTLSPIGMCLRHTSDQSGLSHMPDPNFPRPRRAIQRATSKLARYADACGVVALRLLRGCVEFSETKLGELFLMLSPQQAEELARRDRERPRGGPQWLTADESALVKVLADLIVPSDEESPGAEQMDVLGRSAVGTLDRLVAGSQRRQALYARGLLALDRLAKDECKATFVALSQENQVHLLQFVDRLQQEWSKPMSLTATIKTKIVILYHKWRGLFPAAELFPTLVQDVLQAFYTNRVSWVWLDYDGPPMPEGYPNPLDRRPRVQEAVTQS